MTNPVTFYLLISLVTLSLAERPIVQGLTGKCEVLISSQIQYLPNINRIQIEAGFEFETHCKIEG